MNSRIAFFLLGQQADKLMGVAYLISQGSENYFDHIKEKWLTHSRFPLKMRVCCAGQYKQSPGVEY